MLYFLAHSPHSGRAMFNLHTAIVLRSASAMRSTTVLLDEQLGKIEAIVLNRTGQQLFHGALITCTLKKSGVRYLVKDVRIIDTPHYWARENFEFFHHILELCHTFLPWDKEPGTIFTKMCLLYTHPEEISSLHDQKLFLEHFFASVGYSDVMIGLSEYGTSLQTVGFLKTLGLFYEKPA